MACTVVMIASAMPQAIRQYSIAVAPFSSRKNLATSRIKFPPPPKTDGTTLGSNGCGEVEQHAEQGIKRDAEIRVPGAMQHAASSRRDASQNRDRHQRS